MAISGCALPVLVLGMIGCGSDDYCRWEPAPYDRKWNEAKKRELGLSGTTSSTCASPQHATKLSDANAAPRLQFLMPGTRHGLAVLVPQDIWQSTAVPSAYNVNSFAEIAVTAPLAARTSASAGKTVSQYAPRSPQLLYKADYDANKVLVYDPVANSVTANVVVGTHPRGLAATPDGSQVWVVGGFFARLVYYVFLYPALFFVLFFFFFFFWAGVFFLVGVFRFFCFFFLFCLWFFFFFFFFFFSIILYYFFLFFFFFLRPFFLLFLGGGVLVF
jgi:YVTN family beta-propeller protein